MDDRTNLDEAFVISTSTTGGLLGLQWGVVMEIGVKWSYNNYIGPSIISEERRKNELRHINTNIITKFYNSFQDFLFVCFHHYYFLILTYFYPYGDKTVLEKMKFQGK